MADDQADPLENLDAANLDAFREILRHVAREEIRHMVATFGIALAREVERRMTEISAALAQQEPTAPPPGETLQ